MLVTGQRRATWIPIVPMLLAAPFLAVAVLFLVTPASTGMTSGPPRQPPPPYTWAMFAGIGGLMLFYAVAKVRRFTRVDDQVLVRSLFLRLDLRPTVAAGYTMRGGHRSAAIFIYFADGRTTFDVMTMLPYRPGRAARIAETLERVLELEPSATASQVATKDHAQLVAAREQVYAYYKTPTFRRTMIALAIGLVVYLGVMAFLTMR